MGLVNVLFPIFAIILLGWLARRFRFPGEGFWPGAELATNGVFFPCLLTSNLAVANGIDTAALPMAGALVSGVVVMVCLLLLLRRRLGLEGGVFISVFQGGIRPNCIVALAASLALAGTSGVATSAVAIVTLIPLVNLLSVPVGSSCGCGNDVTLFRAMRYALLDPLTLACILGIVLNRMDNPLPAWLFELAHLLGRAALPVGLLSVGAALDFGGLRANLKAVSLAALLKLAVLPLLTALGCLLYATPPTAASIAILFAASPASASLLFARRYGGGDDKVSSAVVSVQMALSALTLPVTVALMP